jgi:hypothetical protein
LNQANNLIDANMDQEADECLEHFTSDTAEMWVIDDLDCAITEDEIISAIQHMNNGKASGPDGIALELYKLSQICVPCLYVLYNHILQTGVYPEKVFECTPIHTYIHTIWSPIHTHLDNIIQITTEVSLHYML